MKLLRILSRLVIAGSLLLVPSYSVASAKSPPQIRGGQSCRKVGEVSGTLASSFVCTKVGKKLVWRKVIISQTTTTSIMSVSPAAPTGLTFAIKTPFDDTGTISWVDNSNNEEFFYISNIDPATLGATPLASLFGKKASNSTSAGVYKFVSGVTYCYWVMSSNSFGNSAWAGPVCSNPALTSTATTANVPPTTAYVPPTTAYVPPTTAYVPPTTAYVPSYGGGGSSRTNWIGCYFKGQRMWGSVYITPYSWAADFAVYQSSYSWSADLKVYNTSYSWAATSCGNWYITPYSWAADFTVYLTPYSWNADFSIYSTAYSWGAGR